MDVRLTPDSILAHAERLFADEQYWDAIQQLEPLVRRAEGPTQARTMMLLAQAYMKNPLWTRRAEGVLQSLVHENPRHVEAHLLLAELYRATQLPARARAMYRKVLDIQPGHDEATRALAFLDPKGEGMSPPSTFSARFRKR